jgi:hypothetical protein
LVTGIYLGLMNSPMTSTELADSISRTLPGAGKNTVQSPPWYFKAHKTSCLVF